MTRVFWQELKVRGQTVEDLCVELGVDASDLERAIEGDLSRLWIVRELKDRALLLDDRLAA